VDVKIAKIPFREERERWYHPSAQGMVKEVYRKGPVKFLGWSRAGYTATSTLLAYGREEVRPVAGIPTQPGTVNRQEPTRPPAKAARQWPVLLLVIGTAAFGALLLRYARRKRAGRPRKTM
jgi:hypothetical protein